MFSIINLLSSRTAEFLPRIRITIGSGRRSALNHPSPRYAFWNSAEQGTYRNPNRRLPRKQMLAARRAEQLSRGRA